MKDWNQELQAWLIKNNLELNVQIIVVSPLGDPVKPGNFIPQGWTLRPTIGVVANGKPSAPDPGNGLPDILNDVGDVVG